MYDKDNNYWETEHHLISEKKRLKKAMRKIDPLLDQFDAELIKSIKEMKQEIEEAEKKKKNQPE